LAANARFEAIGISEALVRRVASLETRLPGERWSRWSRTGGLMVDDVQLEQWLINLVRNARSMPSMRNQGAASWEFGWSQNKRAG
jgi:C4-dicarboxylate-specific signal transduction histidine kinase